MLISDILVLTKRFLDINFFFYSSTLDNIILGTVQKMFPVIIFFKCFYFARIKLNWRYLSTLYVQINY